jgi:hypothetical protein
MVERWDAGHSRAEAWQPPKSRIVAVAVAADGDRGRGIELGRSLLHGAATKVIL